MKDSRVKYWLLTGVRFLVLPITYTVERILIAVASERTIEGFQVLAEPDERIFSRVASALQLLKRIDRRRFERLRRDVRYILVWDYTAFWVITRTVTLHEVDVLERSDAVVATLLVHEGTHARLERLCAPFVYKHRIEVRCMLEELHFAELLPRDEYPNTEQWLGWIRGRLSEYRQMVES